jgi:hypothetical protein
MLQCVGLTHVSPSAHLLPPSSARQQSKPSRKLVDWLSSSAEKSSVVFLTFRLLLLATPPPPPLAALVSGATGGWPRTALPGSAPVSTPPSNTSVPLTTTCTIPADGVAGSASVARSMMLAGSKTVISASIPTPILPLVSIAGQKVSRRFAGPRVHFRSASLQLSSSFSRTCTAQSYYISRHLCNDAGPHQERQSAEHTHAHTASERKDGSPF